MFKKGFGEKVKDNRREAALLYPRSYAPDGHAGVYIKHYVTGGNYMKRDDDEYGPHMREVQRPTRDCTDVIISSEKFTQLDVRTIKQGRFTSDERYRSKVLRAIDAAFADAADYADTVGVPVDLEQTHADIHLAWER